MTKTQALTTLINQSKLFSASQKEKLLTKVPLMSAQEIDELGAFLAQEVELAEKMATVADNVNST